jgi:hypothetical protein
MKRTLILSPVLLLLVGCIDLSGLIPDDGQSDGFDDGDAETSIGEEDDGDEDTTAQPDADPETEPETSTGCCSFAVEGPAAVTAGEVATFTVSLLNDDGEDVSGEAAFALRIIGPDGGSKVSGLSFQPMIAGDYQVSVVVEMPQADLEETLALKVDIGAVETLSLSLSSASVDPGDEVEVSVTAWDAAGNIIPAPDVELSVSPSSCAAVDGDILTALEDSLCAVTASSGRASESSMLTIDGNGPHINMTEPSRASFLSAGSTTIAGQASDTPSGIASLVVHGQSFTSGSFSMSADLEAGVHTITVSALDQDGNASDMSAGVIVGDFLEDDEGFPGIWTMTGADAIDAMADDLGSALPTDEIEDSILDASPLLDDGTECDGMTVDVTAASIGSAVVEMTPLDGTLEAVVTIADLEIDLAAEVRASFLGQCLTEESTDQVVVDQAEVVLSLELSVDGGAVVVDVRDSTSSTSGVDDGMAGDLGIDVSAMVEELMLEMVEDSLPAGIESAFESAAIEETVPMMDAEVSLLGSVDSVQVSTDGIALEMETLAECADVVMDAPGSLSMVDSTPTLTEDSAAISLDVLNRMLHLAWRSGSMNETISNEEMGLDASIIGLIFPGASTLSLDLSPQLPPVIADVSAGESMSLEMAELQLEAWGEVDGTEQLLGEMAVHLSGEVVPGIDDGALRLSMEVSAMSVDTLNPEPSEVASAESLEDLIGLFGGSLGSELLSDVSLSLPAALGTPVDAETDGSGWLIVSVE